MKMVKLEDILPTAAIDEVSVLISEGKRHAADFKPVMHKYALELAAKGCDPDYIAYAIEYACTRFKDGG